MNGVTRMVALGALLGLVATIGGHTQEPGMPEEIIAYEEAIVTYSVDEARQQAPARREQALAAAEGAPIAQRAFLTGQVHLLTGIHQAGLGEARTAISLFEQALELANEAIARRQRSEYFRLKAEALMQLLRLRGLAFRIGNAGAARSAADRAVELDPQNPRALIVAASYYGMTPALAGGDPPRALENLSTAISLAAEQMLRNSTAPGQSRAATVVSFSAWMWRGIVLAEQGDGPGARRAYDQAAGIFANSEWLRSARAEL